jgi:hypothetical protein
MARSSLWLDRNRLERALSAAGVQRKSAAPADSSLRRFGLEPKPALRAASSVAPPRELPVLEGALKNRLADYIEWLMEASQASCAYVLDADGIATVNRHRGPSVDDRVLPVATALLDTLRLVKGPLREDGVNHAAVALPGCGMVEIVATATNLGPYFAAWASQSALDRDMAAQAAVALRSAINGQGE